MVAFHHDDRRFYPRHRCDYSVPLTSRLFSETLPENDAPCTFMRQEIISRKLKIMHYSVCREYKHLGDSVETDHWPS